MSTPQHLSQLDYENAKDLHTLQRENLLRILQEEKFTDLKFVLGKEKTIINANRAFLASVSKTFEKLLYPEDEAKQPYEIELPDVSVSAFESVLSFAYCNDPHLTADNVLSLKFLCERFEIDSLSQICSDFWTTTLTAENICSLLLQSVVINSVELIQQCMTNMNKFSANANVMISSSGFMQMNLKSMIIFLQTKNLRVQESHLWEAIMIWAEHQRVSNQPGRKSVIGRTEDAYLDEMTDATFKRFLMEETELNLVREQPWKWKLVQPKERKELLMCVKPFIRWGAMDPVFFIKNVAPQGIFTKDELLIILKYFQCPEEGCGSFLTKRRSDPKNVVALRGEIELAKWTYNGAKKRADAVAFLCSQSCLLDAVGVFNCKGKCFAKVRVYRGENGKHGGMDVVGETNEEEIISEEARGEPVRLKLLNPVRIEENEKYTVELFQTNENGEVSYQIKDGLEEVVVDDQLKVFFSKAAASKNGTSVHKGAVPTLYFRI